MISAAQGWRSSRSPMDMATLEGMGHPLRVPGAICIRGGVPQCVDECSKGLIMVPKLQAALADEGNRWVFKDIYLAIENGYLEPQNFFPQF